MRTARGRLRLFGSPFQQTQTTCTFQVEMVTITLERSGDNECRADESHTTKTVSQCVEMGESGQQYE